MFKESSFYDYYSGVKPEQETVADVEILRNEDINQKKRERIENLIVKFEKKEKCWVVEMNEWRVIMPGEVGYTLGAGPCAIVAILSSESGKALLGHWGDLHHGLNEEFVNLMKENFDQNEMIDALLAGDLSESDQVVEAVEKDAVEMIQEVNLEKKRQKADQNYLASMLTELGYQEVNLRTKFNRHRPGNEVKEVSNVFVDKKMTVVQYDLSKKEQFF